MKVEEPIYDLSLLAQCNYHIHTVASTCAHPEMTIENILLFAEKAGMKKIALVDHHHIRTHDILKDLARIKGELEGRKNEVEVLVGAELSAYGIGKYSDSIETNSRIDYRLYACNHYHLDFWEHPPVSTAEAYARHAVSILSDLLISKRADCIAHSFVMSYLKSRFKDIATITKIISDKMLADILELGKKHKVAWEINKSAVFDDPGFAKRYWNIGREVGVTFRLGTDAHRLADIDSKQYISKIKSILS